VPRRSRRATRRSTNGAGSTPGAGGTRRRASSAGPGIGVGIGARVGAGGAATRGATRTSGASGAAGGVGTRGATGTSVAASEVPVVSASATAAGRRSTAGATGPGVTPDGLTAGAGAAGAGVTDAAVGVADDEGVSNGTRRTVGAARRSFAVRRSTFGMAFAFAGFGATSFADASFPPAGLVPDDAVFFVTVGRARDLGSAVAGAAAAVAGWEDPGPSTFGVAGLGDARRVWGLAGAAPLAEPSAALPGAGAPSGASVVRRARGFGAGAVPSRGAPRVLSTAGSATAVLRAGARRARGLAGTAPLVAAPFEAPLRVPLVATSSPVLDVGVVEVLTAVARRVRGLAGFAVPDGAAAGAAVPSPSAARAFRPAAAAEVRRGRAVDGRSVAGPASPVGVWGSSFTDHYNDRWDGPLEPYRLVTRPRAAPVSGRGPRPAGGPPPRSAGPWRPRASPPRA
jgi:hypothetical protein